MYQNIEYLAVTSDDATNPPEGVDPQAWALAVDNDLPIITVDEYDGAPWGEVKDHTRTYYAEIPNTTSSDYNGSLIDVANRQYFADTYGDGEGEAYFLTRTYGYNGEGLYVNLHLTADDDTVGGYIWDEILGLLNYPLADDEIHSDLEREAVDAYVEGDFTADVRWTLENSEREAIADAYGDDLTAALFAIVYPQDGCDYPYVEGVDGVVLPYDAETAADLLTANLEAWQQAQTIHPDQLTVA